jgi:succinate dehydrogenase/fumarate reductase flavoprotein subunit
VTGWDLDYDVVVGGYGFAGGMAAISANDEGASVALFEKTAHFGGNSILSGGSCAAGQDYAPTLAYLERTCGDATDHDVLEVFAQGMVELPALLARLAGEVGFETVVDRRGGTYPFPGSDQILAVHVSRNERYKGYPWATGIRAGGTLFWILAEQIQRRPGIEVRYNAPIVDLVAGEDNIVLGVLAEVDGRQVRVRARRAVILCTGGFEHNETLLKHYLPIPDAMAMSSLGNTGDGIVMGQKLGAALWHMWLLHGGYGFKVPGSPVAFRHDYSGFRSDNRPMPWIAVDRFGKRFMDEYPPAPQDTPIRALEYYDPDIQDFPRIPCYLVLDERGRKLGPLAKPIATDDSATYEWSDDNLTEVAKGYVVRAATLEGLAGELGIDKRSLRETVQRWNDDCGQGQDRDHRRPAGTMMPLDTPPFYAIPAWPIITNTQGGLRHNARQQVLDSRGEPIPRLYKAGENGSLFGHLYMLAGNNSECFIGGEIAGRNAAQEPAA